MSNCVKKCSADVPLECKFTTKIAMLITLNSWDMFSYYCLIVTTGLRHTISHNSRNWRTNYQPSNDATMRFIAICPSGCSECDALKQCTSADAARPIIFLLMYCASPLACSLIRAHPKRGVCIRAKEGNGGGNRRRLVSRYLFCSAL